LEIHVACHAKRALLRTKLPHDTNFVVALIADVTLPTSVSN